MRAAWALLLLPVLACNRMEPTDEDQDGGEDLATARDLADAPRADLLQVPAPDLLPAAKDQVLASGRFSQAGTASLVRKADGSLALAFSDDFRVTLGECLSTPPDETSIVLMSVREQIPMWDARFDVKIDNLKSTKGAQTYPLKESDPVDRPYIHIFCSPNPRLPFKHFTMSMATVRLP